MKVVSRGGRGLAALVTFDLARFRLVYSMKKCWLPQPEPLHALGDQTHTVTLAMDGICMVVFE